METILDKLTRFFGAWRIGVLDESKDSLWTKEPEKKNIPYLKAKNAEGKHIFMQPADESAFLMADDLTWERVLADHQVAGKWKPGRMCVETSPGNFQVWMHSDRALSHEDKEFWLVRLGSDPHAGPRGRWGRMPGFRNRKAKHQTAAGFPLARLLWCDYRNRVSIPTGKPGSLPPSPQGGERVPSFSRSTGTTRTTKQTITRSDYESGDESRTDFAYVLALLRRGIPESEIHQRLMAERGNWTKHQQPERYIERTIRKAKAEIEGAV